MVGFEKRVTAGGAWPQASPAPAQWGSVHGETAGGRADRRRQGQPSPGGPAPGGVPGQLGGRPAALTCRREPPGPAVVRAGLSDAVRAAGGRRELEGKVWKSDTNANVLPSKSPRSPQLKLILNFPPQRGRGDPERLPAFPARKS